MKVKLLPCEKEMEMAKERNSVSRGGQQLVPFSKVFPSLNFC